MYFHLGVNLSILGRSFQVAVMMGLVVLVGCDYASRTKEALNNKDKKDTEQSTGPSVPREPTYVLADPVAADDLTGINGGYRFLFEPPEFSGEWTQSVDTDVVRFFILNASGSENVAVQPESFYVRSSENVIFSLDPELIDGSEITSSFSLADRNLSLAMNSTVEVVMNLPGKSFRATLNRIDEGSGEQNLSVDD